MSEPPLGRDTVAAMTAAFTRCELETQRLQRLRGGAAAAGAAPVVSVRHFVEACGSTVSLYAHVFSPGSFVARVLGRTTTRHIACVTTVAAQAPPLEIDPPPPLPPAAAGAPAIPAPASSLRALLAWERDARGRDAVRWDRSSACHTAMWLSRGLLFCQTFMDLLANGDCGGAGAGGGAEVGTGTGAVVGAGTMAAPDRLPGPRVCASVAYNRTLRPYHGLLLATVFRAALSYAPAERDELFGVFGYADMREGEVRVRECVAAMRPVTQRVHGIIVDEGLDFQDQVTPLSGSLK